ncbi:uncharacterized protein TNCV_5117891 [Trichonephila clavipes]|nr:uncharacterized protein TNCV_5117891 [Trichonephila clavipes]
MLGLVVPRRARKSGPNSDCNNKLLDCPDNQQWSSTADVVFFIKSLKCALEKSEVSDGNGNRTNHPHEGIDQETLLFLSKWLRNELLSRTSQVSMYETRYTAFTSTTVHSTWYYQRY